MPNQKEEQNYYKNVLESLQEFAVFTFNAEELIVSWNTGAENIFGYSDREILGKKGHLLFTQEDIKRGIPEEEMTTALSKGKAIDERFHLKKDGSKFWASGLMFPLFDEQGKHIGFTKIVRNYSERKLAENQLIQDKEFAKTIVDIAPESVVVLNKDLTIKAANKAFYKLFKVDKKEAEGQSIAKIDNGRLSNSKFLSLLDKLTMGAPFADEEIEQSLPGTGRRYFKVAGRKLQHLATLNEFIALYIIDITERKILERQREDFISIASHELKSPVTGILGYSQIIQGYFQKAEDQSMTEPANRLHSQAVKLNKLITNLLDISSINTDRFSLNFENFNLTDLTSEIVRDLQFINKTYQITFKGEVENDVCADKSRITQILTNLISNAIKYSPEGKQVVVSLSNDLARTQAIISVKDFGIGISDEEKDKIFKRFSRSVNGKNNHIPGIGLGLYISMEIAKKHKGNIWFESEKGVGTTFYLSLPFKCDR
ncbi:PAS domain-containing sensor histidine kinase [Rubrolithibacter danxiaensis]|uniref:PAS domain-containing sensor histidine kinase n=1 Tax=Rubrolithibacter danxiaensis TaxID=3390805 RepID=UPI003BF7E844